VLIELFSLGVTAEALRAKSIEDRRFRRNGVSLAQNVSIQGGIPHQTFFVSENLDNRSFLWYKIQTEVSFVLSQFTRLTDGRTDRHFSHG